MKITLQQIAEHANVSIATVSHVLNKTRYVSPQLEEKVLQAIDQMGYQPKNIDKENQLKIGKHSEIAFLIPTVHDTQFSELSEILSSLAAKESYSLSVYMTHSSSTREKYILSNLLSNKKISGIIIVPESTDAKMYTKLLNSDIPFVFMGGSSDFADAVTLQDKKDLHKATSYLINNGHRRIILILEGANQTALERKAGYLSALQEHSIEYDEALVVTTEQFKTNSSAFFRQFDHDSFPSAIIACGDNATVETVIALKNHGLACPDDISVIGFGNGRWLKTCHPELTVLSPNLTKLAELTFSKLIAKINHCNTNDTPKIVLPLDFQVSASTTAIERGPLGERGYSPEQLSLTDEEIAALRASDYTVGISYHYSGTDWTRLHEKAIRTTLGQFGIKIAAITEAHFNPDLQIAQLEGLRMQQLDAIISMPIDEAKAAQKYKELSSQTKLIFLGGLPHGFQKQDYCSVVSVNEIMNGKNAAKILGDYFEGRQSIKVGMINHGLPHFITRQRDYAAKQFLIENYQNIEIVGEENFYRTENTYDVTKKLMEEHPEIEGLYTSWNKPALEVIRALRDINRTDVSITTVDIDSEIASYMAEGQMVRGISALRPYEHGKAAALATANALLGKTEYKYVGVNPKLVLCENIHEVRNELFYD